MPPIGKSVSLSSFELNAENGELGSEGQMNMRVFGIIVLLFCCAFSMGIYSEPS